MIVLMIYRLCRNSKGGRAHRVWGLVGPILLKKLKEIDRQDVTPPLEILGVLDFGNAGDKEPGTNALGNRYCQEISMRIFRTLGSRHVDLWGVQLNNRTFLAKPREFCLQF